MWCGKIKEKRRARAWHGVIYIVDAGNFHFNIGIGSISKAKCGAFT
jgi:hypothetical protein